MDGTSQCTRCQGEGRVWVPKGAFSLNGHWGICSACDPRPTQCPVCGGSKLSSYVPSSPCGCCDGTGTIPMWKELALASIRGDLSRRIIGI